MHLILLLHALIRRLAIHEQRRSLADSAAPWDSDPDDRDTAAPWWRVELSGFHLLLWVGLPFLAMGLRIDPRNPPLWMEVVGGLLMLGWFIKFVFWMQLLHDDDDAAIAQYRWFGTAEGTLAASTVVSVIGFLTWYALR